MPSENVQRLQDQKNSRIKWLEEDMARGEKDPTSVTAEDRSKWDGVFAEIETLSGDIARAQKLEIMVKEGQIVPTDTPGRHETVGEPGAGESRLAIQPLKDWLRTGKYPDGSSHPTFLLGGLSSAKGVTKDEARFQILAQNMDGDELRALSVGDRTSGGGITVDQDLAPDLYKFMRLNNAVEQAGTRMIRTATGMPLSFPRMDDTEQDAIIVGEGQPITGGVADQDPDFTQVPCPVHKYSSRRILISNELLQDSEYDLSAELEEALGTRIGRGFGKHGLYGTGSGMPPGLLRREANVANEQVSRVTTTIDATAANFAAGNISIPYDTWVDIMFSVGPLHRDQATWLLPTMAVQAAYKVKDDEGRPIWLPSLVPDAPNTILGKPYVETGFVAGANGTGGTWVDGDGVLLFGNFRHVVIRTASIATFRRLEELYAESDQVGFFILQRKGQAYLGGKSPNTRALVKAVANVP